jgi:hypothetical protein
MSICSIDDGPIGGNNFGGLGQGSMLNKFGNSNSSMLND